MKVTICFPNHNYRSPIGGYKMVYEYANRLVEEGCDVNIVYCTQDSLKKYKLPEKLRCFLAKLIVSRSPHWFKLDDRVNKIAARRLEDKFIPDADYVVATAAQTARPILNLPISKGKKVYFIQDYENWVVGEKDLIETYKMGMKNITVSEWLYKIVVRYAPENTICIKNPIDTNIYKVNTLIEKRKKFYIGMLYHDGEYKGCDYALKAIFEAKKEIPEIELLMFGNPVLPDEYNLPWIHYKQHATQKETVEIYNKCSVFVCATIEEGFGLTGLESMACGCAFASTDYLGVHEYAENNLNALLSPIKDVDALKRNIIRLIKDDELRYQLSKNASKRALDFSWERAMKQLNKEIGFEN